MLEHLPAILSRSATATSACLDTLEYLNSFKLDKQKKDALDHEDQLILAQLVQEGKDFDVEADEVHRLEEMKKKLEKDICSHRMNMVAHLEAEESYRVSLTETQRASNLFGQQLFARKDKNQAWMMKLREAEAVQTYFPNKWERLRSLDH